MTFSPFSLFIFFRVPKEMLSKVKRFLANKGIDRVLTLISDRLSIWIIARMLELYHCGETAYKAWLIKNNPNLIFIYYQSIWFEWSLTHSLSKKARRLSRLERAQSAYLPSYYSTLIFCLSIQGHLLDHNSYGKLVVLLLLLFYSNSLCIAIKFSTLPGDIWSWVFVLSQLRWPCKSR